MALRECEDCKRMISTSAKSCPHCGRGAGGSLRRNLLNVGSVCTLFGLGVWALGKYLDFGEDIGLRAYCFILGPLFMVLGIVLTVIGLVIPDR